MSALHALATGPVCAAAVPASVTATALAKIIRTIDMNVSINCFVRSEVFCHFGSAEHHHYIFVFMNITSDLAQPALTGPSCIGLGLMQSKAERPGSFVFLIVQ
jgi:hypothetical protein